MSVKRNLSVKGLSSLENLLIGGGPCSGLSSLAVEKLFCPA